MSDAARPGRGGRRRASIGILDQLLYSLTNFALTVVVARNVGVPEFGTYSLVIATYLIGAAVIRGLTSETLVVRFSAAERSEWRRGATDAGGASLVAGVLFGAGLVVASFFTPHGTMHTTLLTFGVLFPGLMVQDFLRFAALALGRPALALVNDVSQALLQFGALAVLIAMGHKQVWVMVAAWGGSAYLAAVIGALTLRLAVRPFRARAWLRGNFDLAGRYALDDLASQGGQQGTTYVVAGVGGLTDAGALRGAQTVFGPPSILNLGVQAAITPELVRVLQHSTRRMRGLVVRLGLAMGAVGLVWGLATLVAPNSLGHQLFGDTWHAARPLLVFFVVAQTANGIRVAPMAGLRALGAANRTLVARSFVIAAGLVFQVAGAIADGARGVAIATAIVSPIQALVWWSQFEVGLRDHRRERTQRRVAARWNDLVDSTPGSDRELRQQLPILARWPE